jgi:hypothetical protein
MNVAEVAAQLAGDQRDYENALAIAPKVDALNLAVELISRLDESDLPNAERERRLTAVYARLSLSFDDLSRIAAAGAGIKNLVLKNALTQLLPAQLKLLAITPSTNPTAWGQVASDRAVQVAKPSPVAVQTEPTAAVHVVILSREADAATIRRLEEAGFGPLRCETVEELQRILGSPPSGDICGFLLETTFLEPLQPDEQAAVLESLAAYSTFAFIRIQEDGLKHGKLAVMEIIRTARCSTLYPSALQVSFQGQAGLRELEVKDLVGVREQLAVVGAAGLFSPGELSDSELALLAAAMAQYAGHKRFGKRARLSSVRTTFLGGGSTGAKVAAVTLDGLRFPVVVKIDSKNMILDEARRFLKFISDDDRELRPEIHFHGDASLIIFDVISDLGSDTEPAPTLEQRLREHWYDEMGGQSQVDAAKQLIDAFASAVRKLAVLNTRACHDHDIECKANPYVLGIQRMERAGFNWRLGQERVSVREEALRVLKSAERVAVSHGDSHGRNILIRKDQGFLIDYQFSGPGHPCADLARLESSIFFSHFHAFGNEGEVISLQQDLTDGTQGIDALLEKHKTTIVSNTNEIVIRMCAIARDAARQVLTTHGLGPEHYKSAKLLSAWQSLQVPSMQQGLVRATIIALS